MENSLLTLLVFVPSIGALACLLLPKPMVRGVALLTTVITFGLSLLLIPSFLDGGDPQGALEVFGGAYGDKLHFVQRIPWITGESFKIEYFVGVDGLNMPLVVLTAFVSMLATSQGRLFAA